MRKHFEPNLIIKVTSPKVKHRFEEILCELVANSADTHAIETETSIEFKIADSKKEVDLCMIRHPNPANFVDQIYADARILPRFVSNIFLVDETVKDEEGIVAYAKAHLASNQEVLSIRAHPKNITKDLASKIVAEGIQCRPRPGDCTSTLHVCKVYSRWCVSIRPSDVALVSEVRLDESMPFVVCRAIFKIREALWTLRFAELRNQRRAFLLDQFSGDASLAGAVRSGATDLLAKSDFLSQCPVCGYSPAASGSPPHSCSAIDIGASPGGWTFFLASRGLSVAAVDPGQLALAPEEAECSKTRKIRRSWLDAENVRKLRGEPHASAEEKEAFEAQLRTQDGEQGFCDCKPEECGKAGARRFAPSITHYPHKLQECIPQLANSEFLFPLKIVVCDINVDPREATNMILDLCLTSKIGANGNSVPGVAPDAVLVLTLKETTPGLLNVFVKQCCEALQSAFDVLDVRRLLSNGQECTVVGRRKAFATLENGSLLPGDVSAIKSAQDIAATIMNEAYQKHGTAKQKEKAQAEAKEMQKSDLPWYSQDSRVSYVMPVDIDIHGTKLLFDPRPQEAQEKGTGVHMWDSGRALADYCVEQKRKLKIQGAHVLELGSGCGLGGMGAALAGAKTVLLTDIEEICGILSRHTLMNSVALQDSKVGVAPFLWDTPTDTVCNASLKLRGQEQTGHCEFDFIVGADVVFTVPMILPLLNSLQQLANEKTKIIIVFEKRCHVTFDQFFVEAKQMNFSVKEIKLTSKPNPFIHMFQMKKLRKVAEGETPAADDE